MFNLQFDMYFAYILFSESSQKYYTGSTSSIEHRITRHNEGRNLSTKHGIPWALVWSKELETLSEARLLEIRIKKRGAKRILIDIEFRN